MPKEEWFRRTTWSPQDQTEYFAKLKRARATSRPQYLRIQAHHLFDAGLHREALRLLDLYFQDYPGELFAADGYFLQARVFAALGDDASAIAAFQNALSAERKRPNVGGDTWLIFPEFIIKRNLAAMYGEAEKILEEFYSESKLAFPIQRFRYHFLRAFLADVRQNLTERKLHAEKALAETQATHSGFRYHAKLGLADSAPPQQLEPLKRWVDTA